MRIRTKSHENSVMEKLKVNGIVCGKRIAVGEDYVHIRIK